jgi:hypothetical protein
MFDWCVVRIAVRSVFRFHFSDSLDQKALHTVQLHNIQPVFRAGLVFHAIEVVLHRLLGKRKMIGNLFVGQALRD